MKNPINFFDAELINNELWFSNKNFNALMKMNSETGETEMVSTFEGFPPEEENLHIKTILSGDLLIFIPHLKNTIHIWNIEKNCFEKSIVIDYEKSGYFIDAFKDDNDIIWIFLNKLSDPVILFDINKRETSTFYGIKKISDSEISEEVGLWAGDINYHNNQIYIQANKTNICYSVDCNTKKVEKIVFNENFPIVSNSICDDKFCLSLSGTSDIFEYDRNTKEYVRYEIDNKLKMGVYLYREIIKLNHNLIIIPCHSDGIIIYNTEKREYKKLVFPEGFKRTSPYSIFTFHRIIGNEIYVCPSGCNQLIKINTNDFTLSAVPFVLSDSLEKYSEDTINKAFEKHYHSELNEVFAYKETLGMFIDKLVSEKSSDDKSDDENAGERIHNYIVSLFK